MAEFRAGPTMVATWTFGTQAISGGTLAAGTLTLNADYRTCNFTPTVDVIDGTSGADTSKVKYMGMRDVTVDMTLVQQTGGTALNLALDAGVQGTLVIKPEGTAAGKPVFTIPAFCTGGKFSFPYNDIADISVSFSGQGAYSIS